MTRIGRRDQLVAIERATVVQDGYGEENETWAAIGSEWAAVYYGNGSERRSAAMEQGRQPADFQMLANPLTQSVSLRDRLVLAGSVWDIVGIAPEVPRPGEISFSAIRAL